MCRRCVFLLGFLLVSAAARAGETTIQNDSVTDFDQAAIQVGFVEDERAAAWLTATCNGNLTHVQILWLSITGGSGGTLGQAVEVWQPGAFPVPGTLVRELVGPVLTDGFFNELPIVPVLPMTIGQVVVVSFQFLDPPPGTGPSVVTDVGGCQAGKNGIFAFLPMLPPAWYNACALGVSGDFAIRGVLDCQTPIFNDGFESGDSSEWSVTDPP